MLHTATYLPTCVKQMTILQVFTSQQNCYTCNFICSTVPLQIARTIDQLYQHIINWSVIKSWIFHLSIWMVIVNLSTTWTSLVMNGLLATSDQLSFTLHTTICMSDRSKVYLRKRVKQIKCIVIQHTISCHIDMIHFTAHYNAQKTVFI